MGPSSTPPLELGITLRPEHDAAGRRHIARLAAKLGFGTIWLPYDGGPGDLDGLREAAEPARVGLVLGGDHVRTAPRDVLLEIHASPDDRDRLVAAAGGPEGWRRASVPWDDDEAGRVVLAERHAGRAAVLAALKAASGPRSVALTVAIGRTMSEAAARALRDPALSGVHDPRRTGLFGTLADARGQLLDLAGAGAGAVRATLADERDVADLLVQLRTAAVLPG